MNISGEGKILSISIGRSFKYLHQPQNVERGSEKHDDHVEGDSENQVDCVEGGL